MAKKGNRLVDLSAKKSTKSKVNKIVRETLMYSSD